MTLPVCDHFTTTPSPVHRLNPRTDTDNNGRLTSSEMAHMVRSLTRLAPKRVMEAMLVSFLMFAEYADKLERAMTERAVRVIYDKMGPNSAGVDAIGLLRTAVHDTALHTIVQVTSQSSAWHFTCDLIFISFRPYPSR